MQLSEIYTCKYYRQQITAVMVTATGHISKVQRLVLLIRHKTGVNIFNIVLEAFGYCTNRLCKRDCLKKKYNLNQSK